MLVLFFAIIAASPPCTVPAAERARQLALSYEAFDSAPAPYGWRELNAAGCTDSAVALVAAYGSANSAHLSGEEKREIAFHIGQAYAFADRGPEALRYFAQADDSSAPEEWRAYVAAHVAFFRRDRAQLLDARKRYAAAAGADEMRVKFIDGLVKCPDAPYMQAAHCSM